MIKNIGSLMLIIFLNTAATPVFAAETSSQRWSLDKILARASEKTPEINALRKDIESAEQLARQAGRWDNPDLGFSAGPMTIAGASGHMIDIGIRQSVPVFGQKAIAEKIGEQNRSTVENASNRQILILKAEVIRLAIRFAALDEQAKHTQHRREKLQLIVKFLESRPFASPSQAAERNLVLNRLREIEEKFLEISAARESAWKALNVFLALDYQVVPQGVWVSNPSLPNREQLLSNLEAQSPDLKGQRSLISKASLEAEQAGKKQYPDIRLGAGYNEQTADFPQKTYAGTIELSLPLFDRGDNAKRAALAEKDAATYRLEQKRRELLSQFDQSWIRLQQSKSRIELYPLSLVSTLEKQMDQTEQGWKRGLVPVNSFLELENQVHEQAFKVFDAQCDFKESLAQLQILAGAESSLEEK